jgi:putative membrane protein
MRARAAAGRVTTAGTAAFALAAWDLYLDPQMVAAGHWTWHHPTPALPGVPGIPLTNYLGWVLVAVVMVAVLDRVLPVRGDAPGEAVPAALLAWTWLGSGLANLAFFDRPAVAGYGVVAMGVTVLPYLRLLLSDRIRDPSDRTRDDAPRSTASHDDAPHDDAPHDDAPHDDAPREGRR